MESELFGHALRALQERTIRASNGILNYTWPGNVRELQNCIERAMALSASERITLADLPERIATYQSSHVLVSGDDPLELFTLEEMEIRYIQKVIDAVGGSKTKAARTLGIDRATLYRKLERLKPPSSRRTPPDGKA